MRQTEAKDPKIFKKAILDAKKLGLKSVKFTGAEPLIYHEIVELIKFSKRKKNSVVIETNGTLVDEFTAKMLSKCGVNFISVSLDSSTQNTHDEFRGVEGSFDRALKGAKCLIKQKIPTQIIFSLVRKNKEELFRMPELAKAIGAQSLKINVVEPIARAKAMDKKGDLLDVTENINIFKKFERRFVIEEKLPLPIMYDLPIAFKSTQSLKDRLNVTRCSIHNILGILPDGKVSICGIGFIKKEVILGNLINDSIEEIWKTNNFLKLLRDDIPNNIKGICKICFFKNLCLGKCVALTFYKHNKHDLSFGFCEEAYKIGLFPKTRMITNSLKTDDKYKWKQKLPHFC